MSETKTGPRKQEFVDGALSDLSNLEDDIEGLRDRCERLREEAKGFDGLASSYGTWMKELNLLAGKVADEAEAFRGKMTGEGPKIETSVDADHEERVTEAKAVEEKEGA